jgi:hypothetical protein
MLRKKFMTLKPTLYDLSVEGIQIFDLLEDNLGELTPDLEARLDRLMLQGPERLEAAAMVVHTLEHNATACEAEADRLRQRAKDFEAQSEHLKQRMTKCLDLAFHGKVKTALFSLWTQKAADRIIAELLPGVTAEMLYRENPELVRVKYELDREKCVRIFAYPPAERAQLLPDLVVFEEKEGIRYVRIK